MRWLRRFLLLTSCATIIYSLLSGWLLWRRWGRSRGVRHPADPPPATFFKPLKKGVPEVEAKLTRLARSCRAGDQILIGITSGMEQERIAGEKLVSAFPRLDIGLVVCCPGAAINPKINKLIQLTPRAIHSHWIISDSEAILDEEFVEGFRAEWQESGADALTAPYRFEGGRSLAEQLDELAPLLTLWPGVAVASVAAPVPFILGACFAVRRQHIESLGGWENFGSFLAEDQKLGAALAAAGKQIAISRGIITLQTDRLTWGEYLRHQHRVAFTYRISNPAGFLGMILVQGLAASALLLLLVPRSWPVFGAVAAARLASSAAAARVFRPRIPPAKLPLLLLLGGLLESCYWVAAWLPLRVSWGGRAYRVRRDGSMAQ